MRLPIDVLALAFFFAGTHCHGQGEIIAGHFGDTDPATEEFTLVREGRPSLAPAVNDFGLNAWSIGLDTNKDIGEYYRSLSANEQAVLEAGWILSLTLRVVEPFAPPTLGIFVQLQTGTETLPSFRFGAQPDGDPILRLGNSEYTLEGAGSGYHHYQLWYDADVGLASLWADGTLLATDIAGSPDPTAQLAWGGTQRPPGSAYANWNEVSLRAIPEPGTTALLAIGGALLLAGQRRRAGPGSRKP